MRELLVAFTVAGIPAPAGSKRAFVPKGWSRAIITDANPKASDWKRTVKAVAREVYQGSPVRAPLEVTFRFISTRPKAHYRSGKNAHLLKADAPQFPAGKPDTTKLIRGTEDALTGILWVDDAQIVRQTASKDWGDAPGAVIEVWAIGPEPFGPGANRPESAESDDGLFLEAPAEDPMLSTSR